MELEKSRSYSKELQTEGMAWKMVFRSNSVLEAPREKDGQGMFGEISLQGCGGKMPWEVSSDLFGLAVNIWNVLVFCILAK